ncbi:PilZ domain-containing protein [Simiduia sp. 21SJ11W-1]|uniref:PilZ domain-containing protein n=1 Tax=Simiduia sp. 21SJ11W-1 TaxID=2909669 RepID=UPI00209F0336|nr:PilZ domain-containing protein [Simiduia sp. 21SJ11W-1]UTA46945.1 PilZ domain-containing protein [Simiduia sp. 21SJ11W-1]
MSSQPTHEQRQEFRLDKALTVFIELPAPMDQEPEIVISRCFDISANGLRVIADKALAQGAIVRASVQLPKNGAAIASKRCSLVAETKWARPQGERGEWLMGLALYESEDSDIAQWKTFVAELYLA